jgi:hypothetical protein
VPELPGLYAFAFRHDQAHSCKGRISTNRLAAHHAKPMAGTGYRKYMDS